MFAPPDHASTRSSSPPAPRRAPASAAPEARPAVPARGYLGNRVFWRVATGGPPAVQRCACGGTCPHCRAEEERSSGTVQAKLTVGAPDDEFEREADRVAERVAGGAETDAFASADATPPTIRRLPEGGAPAGAVDAALPMGDARPLSPATLAWMQPRFGADFSGVRVHQGPRAEAAAADLEARAFTRGRDIWLGRGAAEGDRRLMAHELAHVVQQAGGSEGEVRRQPAAAPTEHRFTSHGVRVVVRRSCAPAEFGFATVEAATTSALDAIFDTECIEESRRTRIQNNLTRHGLDIRCRRSAAIEGACAEATGFDIPANIMTLGSRTFPGHPEHDPVCDPIAGSVLHEIVHLVRGVFAEGLPQSCEASCFGVPGAAPDACRDIDVFGRRVR